jgi:deoxyribonuclease V
MSRFQYPNLNLDKFERVQKILASRVILTDIFHDPPRRIAGVDVSFRSELGCAAAVVMNASDMKILDVSYAIGRAPIPYYPGFLGFREIQLSIRSIKGLKEWFDILLCNGHGIAHPRFCGLASHIGVVLSIPTIGVALNPLRCFEYENPSREEEAKPVFYSGKHVGYVLRHGSKYLFISPGNMVSPDSSLRIIVRCMGTHVLPKPLYFAHIYSKNYRW